VLLPSDSDARSHGAFQRSPDLHYQQLALATVTLLLLLLLLLPVILPLLRP